MQEKKNQCLAVQPQALLNQTLQDGSFLPKIVKNSSLPLKSFVTETYNFQKIKDFPKDKNLTDAFSILISKLHILSGVKSVIDDLVKQDLRELILSHYKTFSFEDIYKAFELERFKLYSEETEHFGLFDANYCGSILKKYKNWIIEQKKALQISAPKPVVEIDKKQIRNEFLKTIFDDVSKSGFCDMAHLLYDELIFKQKINPTNDEKRDLYAKELAIHIPIEKENLRTRNPHGFSLLIKKFELEINSKEPITYVQNRCKSILSSEYLKLHITDFETFKKAIK